MGILYLIRHGQASYGQADYDRLSTLGEAQARAIGQFLATARLDALYAGPLHRQQQTAQHAAAAAADAGATLPAAITLPELAEYPAFEMLKHLMPRLIAEDPRFAALESAPTPRML
ncbi:MAG: histidine phosphatase family protein, partial [Kofleriaceae bacterium]